MFVNGKIRKYRAAKTRTGNQLQSILTVQILVYHSQAVFFLQVRIQTCFFKTQNDQKLYTLILNFFHLFSQASEFHKHSKASF